MAYYFDDSLGRYVDDSAANPSSPNPQASDATQAVAGNLAQKYGISLPNDDDESMLSAAGRGFKGSLDSLREAGYGVAGYTGRLIGNDSLRDFGDEGYLQAHQDTEANSRESDSFSSAFIDGQGSKANWAAYWAGYMVSEIGQALVTGGVGSAIAKQAAKKGAVVALKGQLEKEAGEIAAKQAGQGATEEQIAQLAASDAVRKQAVMNASADVGQTISLGALNFGKELGSIYNDATEVDPNNINLAQIAGGAIMAAGLDTVGDKIGLSKLHGDGVTKVGGIGRRMAVEGTKTAMIEGATEFGQQAFERWGAGKTDAASLVNGDDIKNNWREYLDSFMAGAVGGAGVGAVGGALHGGNKKAVITRNDNANTNVNPDNVVTTSNQPNPGSFTTNGQLAPEQMQAVNDAEHTDIASNSPDFRANTPPIEVSGEGAVNKLRSASGDVAETLHGENQIANDVAQDMRPQQPVVQAPPVNAVQQTMAQAANDSEAQLEQAKQAQAPAQAAVPITGIKNPIGAVTKIVDATSPLDGRVGVITSRNSVWVDGTYHPITETMQFGSTNPTEFKSVPKTWQRLSKQEIDALHTLQQTDQTDAAQASSSPPVIDTAEKPAASVQQTPVATEAKTNAPTEQTPTSAPESAKTTQEAQASGQAKQTTEKPKAEPFGIWLMNEHGVDTAGYDKLPDADKSILQQQYGEYAAQAVKPAKPEKLPGKTTVSFDATAPDGSARRVDYRMDKGQLLGAAIHDGDGNLIEFVRSRKGDTVSALTDRLKDRFTPNTETRASVEAKRKSKEIAERQAQDKAQAKKDTASATKLERLKAKFGGEANITPEQERTADLVDKKAADKRSRELTQQIKSELDNHFEIAEEDRLNGTLEDKYGLPKDSFKLVDIPTALKAMVSNIERIFPVKVQFVEAQNEHAHALAEGFYIPSVNEGTIYITTKTQNPFLFVAGHEFAHSIKQRNGALWREFVKRVQASGVIQQTEFAEQARALESQMRKEARESGARQPGSKQIADSVVEEMYADLVGSMLMRPSFIEQLANTAKPELRTPLAKVLHALQEWLSKMKDRISSRGIRGGAAFQQTAKTERIVADMLNKFADIKDQNASNLKADAEAYWSGKAESDIPFKELSKTLQERWIDTYDLFREGDIDAAALMRDADHIEKVHADNMRSERASAATNKPTDDDPGPSLSRRYNDDSEKDQDHEDGRDHAADRSGEQRQGTEQNLLSTVGGGSPAQGWAGATRISGKSGNPVRVFRGASRELTPAHFQADALGAASGNPSSGLGVWFTSGRGEASGYGQVRDHFLDIRNPKLIKADELPGFNSVADAIKYRERLEAQGYDGIIITARHLGKNELHFVAFHPGQVISENGGTDAKLSRRSAAPTGDPVLDSAYEKLGMNQRKRTFREWATDVVNAHQAADLKQGIFDKFLAIKDYDVGAYVKARLTPSADGAVLAQILNGKVTVDADGALDVDHKGGVKDVLEPLQGEIGQYFAWVAGNRANRLAAEAKENNLNRAEIAALMKSNQGTMPDGQSRAKVYADVLKRMNEFNHANLDVAVKLGRMTQELANKFKSDNYYVPFFRQIEDGDFEGAARVAGLAGQQPFHKLQGRAMKTSDLLENVLSNWGSILSASLKNAAARDAVDAASHYQINGVPAAHRAKAGVKGAISIWRNGKTEQWVVNDPSLYASLTSMAPANVGWMQGAFKNMKEWFTKGVTLSPGFKVRNLIRDTVTSMALAEMGKNPLINVYEGMKLTGDANLTATMLAGGGSFRFGTFNEGGRAEMVHKLTDRGVPVNTILDTPAKVAGWMRTALDHYQETGDRAENANRAKLYSDLIDQGVSHFEASFLARDLMDFSLTGSYPSVRFLTSVVPFLNARLQGLYKLGRAGADADNRARFATVAAAVIVASVGNYLWWKDDEDYKKREQWDRDNYWWWKVGSTEFRMPKPFEIGAVATMVERTMEQIVDKDSESKQWVRSLQQAIMDNLAINPIPQVARPINEVIQNQDPFTNRPIESAAMQNMKVGDRYTDHTTMAARALSPVMSNSVAPALHLATNGYMPSDLSPVQIDYLIKGYFGWIGGLAAQTADVALRPLANEGERPTAKKVMGLPESWWQGFVKNSPSDYSRYVTDFYNNARELQQLSRQMDQYRSQGDDDKVEALANESGDKLAQAARYADVTKQLQTINAQIKRIVSSKDMSGDEKRAELDELYAQRNEIARDNELARVAEKQGR